MKIIFGLGNPGDKYFRSRHNIGFLYMDYLRQTYELPDFKSKPDLSALISEGFVAEEKVVLVKPLTFMNLSGDCVLKVLKFFKASVADILVCFDDIDLNFSDVRFRDSGSGGTHNGMKDIILKLGVKDFARIKFGIEVEDRRQSLRDFVLRDFHKSELDSLSDIFKRACEVLENRFF